jgi:hypothetical protein
LRIDSGEVVEFACIGLEVEEAAAFALRIGPGLAVGSGIGMGSVVVVGMRCQYCHSLGTAGDHIENCLIVNCMRKKKKKKKKNGELNRIIPNSRFCPPCGWLGVGL